MSSDADAWITLGSCTIKGNLAVLTNGDIICEKELVESLLLKELTDQIPGRYIVRNSHWGKQKTTIRFAKHNPCQQQWRFSTMTEKLLAATTDFDFHESKAKCDHTQSDIARARPLKSMYLFKEICLSTT